jgi:hypothetical protein
MKLLTFCLPDSLKVDATTTPARVLTAKRDLNRMAKVREICLLSSSPVCSMSWWYVVLECSAVYIAADNDDLRNADRKSGPSPHHLPQGSHRVPKAPTYIVEMPNKKGRSSQVTGMSIIMLEYEVAITENGTSTARVFQSVSLCYSVSPALI